VSELFKQISQLPTDEEKVELLQRNKHPGLLTFFAALQKRWHVTASKSDWVPNRYLDAATIYQVSRRIPLFVDPDSPLASSPEKCRRLWIDLLHELVAEEASLLAAASRNECPIPCNIVLQVYPQLTTGADIDLLSHSQREQRQLTQLMQETGEIEREARLQIGYLKTKIREQRQRLQAAHDKVRAFTGFGQPGNLMPWRG
jgi:hypothetical protein